MKAIFKTSVLTSAVLASLSMYAASSQAAGTITFGLTKRESEVLYWDIKGKTNRDIGDILGTSPRTVNKHLEHVFTKLGVETRTAAASFVASKLRTLK